MDMDYGDNLVNLRHKQLTTSCASAILSFNGVSLRVHIAHFRLGTGRSSKRVRLRGMSFPLLPLAGTSLSFT